VVFFLKQSIVLNLKPVLYLLINSVMTGTSSVNFLQNVPDSSHYLIKRYKTGFRLKNNGLLQENTTFYCRYISLYRSVNTGVALP